MQKSSAVEAYLIEIAERLWSKHASVMVGAGFSKNASKNSHTCKPFLNWHELANVFYNKLYGMPKPEENYLNPLKLADEIQASFGRPALEHILRSAIPDEEYNPALVHEQLMDLPWNDVFTTNYDTLLERACTKAIKYRYDIVLNKEDLVYSQKPRIIKLHGSFPSERPFIISEEDYRKYPTDYAPFVNTVQQSLLENTLCLIGFSGDDPNFLNWIGWIRDNLGTQNSPKIYLIGVLSLSSAQTRLLEQRNIIPVDLQTWLGNSGTSHTEAFASLFLFLKNYGEKNSENAKNWPPRDEPKLPAEYEQNQLGSQKQFISEIWRSSRLSYPGWVICPREARQTLWENTVEWVYGRHLDSLDTESALNFWYELLWRLEKCLLPLAEDFVEHLEKVCNSVNINSASSSNEENEKNNSFFKWTEILFALIRYYREESLFEKCKSAISLLEDVRPKLSGNQIAKLNYEKCLMHIFNLDIPSLKLSLDEWKLDSSHPFWNAKKAGIIAELGNTKEAIGVLEEALHNIRSQLNLSPITNDFTLPSQESYTLLLLKFVKNADNTGNHNNEVQMYADRWNELKKYKCDPWDEFKTFEIKLASQPREQKKIEIKSGFDIGNETTTYTYENYNHEVLDGYSYFRFMEDVGVPFRIKNHTFGLASAIGAARRIGAYSPNLVTSITFRTKSPESLDLSLSREFLYNTSQETIDKLAIRSLKLMSDLKHYVLEADGIASQNIGSNFSAFVPEILSRTSVKNSHDVKLKILDFLTEIYNAPHRKRFKKVDLLTRRLINSWPAEKYTELITILTTRFPVIQKDEITERTFPDPFLFLNTENIKSIDSKFVLNLINQLDNSTGVERDSLIKRFLVLHNAKLINSKEIDFFAQIIWRDIDQSGFPRASDDISKSIFFKIYPSSVDPFAIAYKYLDNFSFTSRKEKNEIKVGSKRPRFTDLTKFSKYLGSDISWTSHDAKKLFNKFIQWWISDQPLTKLRKRDSGSPRSQDNLFISATETIALLVVPFLNEDDLFELEKSILELIKAMEDKAIPASFLKAALIIRAFDKFEYLLKEIKQDTTVNDWNISTIAVRSLTRILESKRTTLVQKTLLSPSIIEAIKWRKFPAVISALANYSKLVEDGSVDLDIMFDEVLFGLLKLAGETDLSSSTPYNQKEKLLARREAAKLAHAIYCLQLQNGLTVPNEILIWKNICANSEEFAEIKNEWTTCR